MKTLFDSAQVFAPSIALERFLSRNNMYFLRTFFFIGSALSGGTSVFFLYFVDQPQLEAVAFGMTGIFVSLWLEQILLSSYHNSFFFSGLNSVVGIESGPAEGPTYDAAKVILQDPTDATKAFFTSSFGAAVLLRSGIIPQTAAAFLKTPRIRIHANSIILPEDRIYTIIDLGKHLFSHDQAFAQLLKHEGVSFETFRGALIWVMSTYHQEKRRLRFWSKDNLSKTNGLGREWTYGVAYLLQRFSRDIKTSAIFSTLTGNTPYAAEKVTEIEVALSQAKTANVLLIGEAGVGKIDLVMAVERHITDGTALDAITQKHIVVLDTNRFFATFGNKQELEINLLNLFDEALHSGNTIIVIENLSKVVLEAESLGVYIPELLDEYLASPFIHVIATDTPEGYHTTLEQRGGFVRRFTEILIESADTSATTRILQEVALRQERIYHTIFTYSSLAAIATAADRYITTGVMPDKAVQLLVDVASQAAATEEDLVDANYVYEVVSTKTGVPAGPVRDEERDLLLHLEDKLHLQVIGQSRALEAIARTMRRARAGIQSSDKPIGSFLFLGPTGVGKTETAKALATIFFGGEHKLQRLDMSEFSGPDALLTLLGTTNQSGTLPDILREHSYCVLLLDEFEKANQSVHDLFLQILDEGVFTDGRGGKVNARNTIIIATSNAGSQLIMRTVQQRQDLAHLSQDIIDGIIRDGIFRPELINRFDSTIIFEPLTIIEQSSVAQLMLGGLSQRVAEKGYELAVTSDLMELLVRKGYSPEFGARPMQRVLQDVVEEKIAQKIIAGEVKVGDTVTLASADFTEAELAV
jgi:ATP-dependent Clp protease ATP-binding subunit ClpA